MNNTNSVTILREGFFFFFVNLLLAFGRTFYTLMKLRLKVREIGSLRIKLVEKNAY